MRANWPVSFPTLSNYGLLWAPVVQIDLNEIRKTSGLIHTRKSEYTHSHVDRACTDIANRCIHTTHTHTKKSGYSHTAVQQK